MGESMRGRRSEWTENQNKKGTRTELVLQPLAVADQRGDMAQHPMGKSNGLGRLEVGEPGHQEVHVLFRQRGHGGDELGEEGLDAVGFPPQVETNVRGHLVVAGTAWGWGGWVGGLGGKERGCRASILLCPALQSPSRAET